MNVRKFRNDTFFFNVHVIWPVSPTEFRDFVRQFDPEFSEIHNFKAICWHGDSDQVIGFRQFEFTDSDLGDLVHETLHATRDVLDSRGITMCDETEECFAYLQNSIFDACLRLMRSAE